jgi:hypothetical protein
MLVVRLSHLFFMQSNAVMCVQPILRVDWQKMEVSNKDQQPTTTLFVVNFDVRKTREVDIERHFDR